MWVKCEKATSVLDSVNLTLRDGFYPVFQFNGRKTFEIRLTDPIRTLVDFEFHKHKVNTGTFKTWRRSERFQPKLHDISHRRVAGWSSHIFKGSCRNILTLSDAGKINKCNTRRSLAQVFLWTDVESSPTVKYIKPLSQQHKQVFEEIFSHFTLLIGKVPAANIFAYGRLIKTSKAFVTS